MLSARLARGPATRYFRFSAAASFAAALFCIGNALLSAGIGGSVAVWATRLALAAACLHQAAWLRFLAAWTHRAPTRAERILVIACVTCAVLVFVPGLGTGDAAIPRPLFRDGMLSHEPEVRVLGALSMFISVVAQVHIVLASLRSRREHPQTAALVVAFLVLLLFGIVDGLTVILRWPIPYIAGLGFVSMSVGVGTVIVGAAVETAQTLERRSSELDRTRLALVERERLASLGELAAVVAHEVRNPLAVVFNALAGLRRVPPGGEDQAVLLGIIEQEANRLKRLVATLLDAVRPFELQVGPRSIAAIVDDSVALATRNDERHRADVTIEIDVPDDTTLACDDVLLAQALSNLVSNALDAPGRTSPVLIRAMTTDGRGGGVRFEVSDNGEGVAEVNRERIFSPFFTTRATGTGLGLTLVKRIAEAHQGSVSLELPAGGGARFVVELPFARREGVAIAR